MASGSKAWKSLPRTITRQLPGSLHQAQTTCATGSGLKVRPPPRGSCPHELLTIPVYLQGLPNVFKYSDLSPLVTGVERFAISNMPTLKPSAAGTGVLQALLRTPMWGAGEGTREEYLDGRTVWVNDSSVSNPNPYDVITAITKFSKIRQKEAEPKLEKAIITA